MKPIITYLSLTLIFGLNASGQFQVVHDLPNTTTAPTSTPLLLGDGSVVTYHWNNDHHIFRKYDVTGDLQWSKGYQASNQTGGWGGILTSLDRDGAGGFVFARFQGTITTDLDSGFAEVLLYEHTFNIIRFDGAGNVTGSMEVKKEYVDGLQTYLLAEDLEVKAGLDGSLVLMVRYEGGGTGGYIDVMKLAPDGMLEWSRSLGKSLPWGGAFPSRTFDDHPNSSMARGQDGTTYVVEGGQFFHSHLRIARLAPDGELLWMKRYVYGNTVNSVAYDGIFVDAAGDAHISGYLITTVGRFHIFMKISPDGELLRTDIYRSPYQLPSYQLAPRGFGVDGSGRRYHFVPYQEDIFELVFRQGILICDTLGSSATFLRRADHIVHPNNVFVPLQHMDVHADFMALTGLLHHEHVDLAYTTRYETLRSFDVNTISSCFLEDTAFAHIPVPMSIMTVEDVPTAVSMDIMEFYSVSNSSMPLVSFGPESLDPLCEFGFQLLGISTDVAENVPGKIEAIVKQSLLRSGDPIRIHRGDIAHVQIWRSDGSLMMQMNLNVNDRSIATDGWSTGVYLIRGSDVTGRTLATERIVLE